MESNVCKCLYALSNDQLRLEWEILNIIRFKLLRANSPPDIFQELDVIPQISKNDAKLTLTFNGYLNLTIFNQNNSPRKQEVKSTFLNIFLFS